MAQTADHTPGRGHSPGPFFAPTRSARCRGSCPRVGVSRIQTGASSAPQSRRAEDSRAGPAPSPPPPPAFSRPGQPQSRKQARPEAAVLRQAIAVTDWEPLERHGGLDAAVQNVLQREQEAGSPNDPGMIDDFRLWGSGRCRQMGRHLSDGWQSIMAAILLRTTPVSQRAKPSRLC